MTDKLLFERDGHVVTLTLNQPEMRNPITDLDFVDAFTARCDEIQGDMSVRCVIITGAGKGFSSGGNIKHMQERTGTFAGSADEIADNYRKGIQRVPKAMYALDVPVIAAVNGPAVGIGMTMQLPMDIRLASENARFGFVFARRGVVPEAASSWFLPRIVGISRALEWTYSGRVFPASEALAGGLVREVLPPDDLLPRAREIAREIVENTSAVSVAMIRQMMWKMLGADHPMEAHQIDSRGMSFMGANADAREGVTSFLEKRPAEFTMKPSSDMPDFYPWWPKRDFK